MSGDKNYDNIIHMNRYDFRDKVVEEVEVLRIKQELLEVKQSKLETILKAIDPLWRDSDEVDYMYNKTTNEYVFKKRK